MANQAYRAKKKINLLLKLKETVICEIISSQEKIIRKEINHFKQICKRKKPINQFEDEEKMKRETH